MRNVGSMPGLMWT